jgi:hypothetical protein
VPDSGPGSRGRPSTGAFAARRRPISTRTLWIRWSLIGCRAGRGRRTRTGSPWAWPRRSGAYAGRARRWRPARPARSRGCRRRRRCRARRSRWRPPSPLEPAEDERTDALRVARCVDGALVHEHEREGATQLGQHLHRGLLDAAIGVGGEQRRHDPVSLVAPCCMRRDSSSSPASRARCSAISARSGVLVRLPLCARARDPVAVGRNVGWAFSQTLAPVVE